MDTLRLGLPYVHKYILNTCIKKTDHIPREVYWTLCTNLHGGLPGGTVVKNPPPMQGTQVRSLVREDPTCCRATKPVHHNYLACALEPTSHNYWAHAPQLLKPACLEPVLHNKRGHCNEKPAHCNKEQPPLAATRESPRATTKTQQSHK